MGVETVRNAVAVTVAGKVRIPYSGPSPFHVEFGCVAQSAECPMRVSYAGQDQITELPLATRGSSLQFDQPSVGAGFIDLDIASPLTLRNWIVTPPGLTTAQKEN